jgi:hypothetical protein
MHHPGNADMARLAHAHAIRRARLAHHHASIAEARDQRPRPDAVAWLTARLVPELRSGAIWASAPTAG